jgi:hypothetical protein
MAPKPPFKHAQDSFALMLEAAGLTEDAHKEYVELEACYAEVRGSCVGHVKCECACMHA